MRAVARFTVVLLAAAASCKDPAGPLVVARVDVVLARPSIFVGETVAARATALTQAGDSVRGRAIAWETSDTTLARIDGNGVVTGVRAGFVTIAATVDGVKGTTTANVSRVPVAAVDVNVPQTSIRTRQEITATAIGRDSTGKPVADAEVVWFSQNQAVATVTQNGVIRGVAPGKSTITVTVDRFSRSFDISVTRVPLASISLDAAEVTLNLGDVRRINATAVDSTGLVVTDRPITWTSADSLGAAVAQNGSVTAIAPSAAVEITACAEEKCATARVSVERQPVNTDGHPFVFYSGLTTAVPPNGAPDIIVAREDGSDLVNLTIHRSSDTDPSWSPDGQTVVFISQRSGNGDIYIVHRDGTHLARITTDSAREATPRFSPDGRRIVFVSTRGGDKPQSFASTTGLWMMNSDGSGLTQLPRPPLARDEYPAWSPDGSQIAFKRTQYEEAISATGVPFTRTVSVRIYIMNADGSNLRPFRDLDPGFIDDAPAWSPDGTQIAFSAFNVNHPAFFENFVIFVANADGTSVRRVTSLGSTSRFPSFSPDGMRLFYTFSTDEFWNRFSAGVAVINVDGTESRIVVYDSRQHTLATSPDAWQGN